MTTIIYIRTSTTEQNPENQLESCKSINKYGEFEVLMDKQSAWKDNIDRENFSILKSKIKKGQIQHLIVWDLDRIYRNRENLISFFKYCKHYNCSIHSVRQDWLEELNKIPEPFNEIMHSLMLQIMGWLAEEESNKKSQRVKAAIRIKKGKTYSHNGKVWGRPKHNLEQEIIKKAKDGKSYREIQKEVHYWDKHRHVKKISLGYISEVLNNETLYPLK